MTNMHKEELIDTLMERLAHAKGKVILDFTEAKLGPNQGEVFLRYLAAYIVALPILANNFDFDTAPQELLEEKGTAIEQMILVAFKEIETKFKEQNNGPKPKTPDPSNN